MGANTCIDGSGLGAVAVRWRLSDVAVGQLFERGQCCCMQEGAPPSMLAGQQCMNYGSACPQSPDWLVRTIQLHITSVDSGDTRIVTANCTDAELTTAYCLPPGLYDLQVTADIDVYDSSCQQFACSQRQAQSPPAMRLSVVADQAVNLDGIVLGVNAPPVYGMTDGGTGIAMCTDAGVQQ
jgi:hypothetical protein